MQYILINSDNTVGEVIPEKDPLLIGFSIEQRYTREFLDKCIEVEDDVDVRQNDTYNPSTGEFTHPIILTEE